MTRAKFKPNETEMERSRKNNRTQSKNSLNMRIEANCAFTVYVLSRDDNKRVPLPSPWRDY